VSRVARGADGAGPLRRAYRRSPLRQLLRVKWSHRGLRANDVFVASYPRSGNAWLAFVALELAGRQPTFDSVRFEVPDAGVHSRTSRAPSLVPGGGRFVKTHEPYQPAYRRAIHLVRDPRDVALSFFRYLQRHGELVVQPSDDVSASFDRYLDAFIAGRLSPHGTWQSHLESWLRAERSGRAQVLRVRYEDLRADPVAQIGRVAGWLKFDVSAERIAEISQSTSLERMREAEQRSDPRVFGRVRPEIAYVGPGALGGWRKSLTADQQRRFAPFSAGIEAMGYEPPRTK
jgi:hypothetical protein